MCWYHNGTKCTKKIFCDFTPRYNPTKCRFLGMCKEYFHYDKSDECSREESLECPMAAKIEDLLMDAEDADRELEFDDEDEIPFNETYDGPEYEGEED